MKKLKSNSLLILLLCLVVTLTVALSSCNIIGGGKETPTDCQHELTAVAEVKATCTEAGTEGYYTCSGCDKLFADAEGSVEIEAPKSIEKLDHSFTSYVSNGDATCEADGTKTAKCDRCDVTDTVTDEGSKLGHKYSTDWIFDGNGHWHVCANGCGIKGDETAHTPNIEAATEYDSKICTVCHYVIEEALGHTTHNYTIPQKDETYHWNKCYGCNEIDGKVEHSYSESIDKNATCTELGSKTLTCNCGYSKSESIAALGHDEISHDAKAPTCLEIGYDAYVTCSRCDYTTYVEKAALGHDEVSHDAKAPTCLEIGYDAYATCSRCDYTTYVEKAALGHDYEATITAPTCEEEGYTTYICTKDENHVYVDDYTDALGHNYSAWEVVTAPTYTTVGLIGADCDVCSNEGYNTVELPIISAENGYILLITGVLSRWQYEYSGVTFTFDISEDVEATKYLYGCESFYIDYSDGVMTTKSGYKTTNNAANFNGSRFGTGTNKTYTTTITVAEATTVKLYINLSRTSSTRYYSNTLSSISVNGKTADVIPTTGSFVFSGYSNYKYFEVATIFLDKGMNTIYFKTITNANTAGIGFGSTVPIHMHTDVIQPAVDATCASTGLTRGIYCSDCGTVIEEQEIVPKIDHTYVSDEAVAATCHTTGLTEGSRCSMCGEVFISQIITPKIAHTYDDDADELCNVCEYARTLGCKHLESILISGTNATCSVPGLTDGYNCASCGEILVAQEVIFATGHSEVVDEAVAATCTTAGKSEGKHCSVCDKVIVAQEEIDALGHNYSTEWSMIAVPTYESVGEITKKCTVCVDVKSYILPIISEENGYTLIYSEGEMYHFEYVYESQTFVIKNYNVVTFDFNGAADPQTVNVINGEAVSIPEIPDYSYTDESGNTYDFIFVDWYCGTEVWNFDNAITSNITIKARWRMEDSFFDVKENAEVRTTGTDIRAMSFNILADDWNDKPAVGPRVDYVISTIHRYMPDVVGLQECDQQWYEALLARDDFKYKLVNVTENGDIVKVSSDYTNYVTIAYNPEILELIEFQQRKLPTGSNKSVRNVTIAVFSIKSTGERFIFASTHFCTTDWQTNKNGTELAEILKEWETNYPSYPIIVCGDFNANEGTTPINNFLNGISLVNAKEKALTKGIICNTYHKGNDFGNSTTRDRESFLVNKIQTINSIDHLFTTSTVTTLFYDTIVDDDALNASDHLPIYCDFKLGESNVSTYSFAISESNPFTEGNGGYFVDNDGDANDVTQICSNKYGTFYEHTKAATFVATVNVSQDAEVDFIIRVNSTNCYSFNYSDVITSLTLNGSSVDVKSGVVRTSGWYADVATGIALASLSLTEGENVITFTFGTETAKELNLASIEFISQVPVNLGI